MFRTFSISQISRAKPILSYAMARKRRLLYQQLPIAVSVRPRYPR